MLSGLAEGFVLAVIAALALGGLTWFWKYTAPFLRAKAVLRRVWLRVNSEQIRHIEELRHDVDALLNVLDHWVSPGAGDKQRQFEYMAEVLEARGQRGCSGASMRVARLIGDD